MKGEFIYLIVICVAVLIFYLIFRREGDRAYKTALLLEQDKKYKEACYKYAEAILGKSHIVDCSRRIQYLWKQHGPFDYQDVFNRIKGFQEYSKDDEGMMAHNNKMSVIANVVSTK